MTDYKILVAFSKRGKHTSKHVRAQAFDAFSISPSQGVKGYVDIVVNVPAGTRIIDETFNSHSALHLNVATATGKGYAWVGSDI